MIPRQPLINTERLILRPFTFDDAERVRELAGDRQVYATTLTIPHPYQEGMAERWIGVPYWNHGYCTEAARALVAYGFESFKLQKFTSRHLADNPASGRVMEKIGMQKEGCQRAHFYKDGIAHDSVEYGLLREDWEKSTR